MESGDLMCIHSYSFVRHALLELQARIPAYLKRKAEKRQASLGRRKQLRFSSECWSMCASMSAQPALSAAHTFSMENSDNLVPQSSTAEQWGEGPNADPNASENASQQPQLPQELLLLLRCITRSAQHALRSHAWLQVINAAIQAWNALRAIGDCAPRTITMHAGNPSCIHGMQSSCKSRYGMNGVFSNCYFNNKPRVEELL